MTLRDALGEVGAPNEGTILAIGRLGKLAVDHIEDKVRLAHATRSEDHRGVVELGRDGLFELSSLVVAAETWIRRRQQCSNGFGSPELGCTDGV